MARNSQKIKTGTDHPKYADIHPQFVDADMTSYADDGEYAMTWAFERVDDTTILQETHVHDAGLDEVYGGTDPVEFDINPDKSTEQFAREVAEEDPELSIELAKEHWNDDY